MKIFVPTDGGLLNSIVSSVYLIKKTYDFLLSNKSEFNPFWRLLSGTTVHFQIFYRFIRNATLRILRISNIQFQYLIKSSILPEVYAVDAALYSLSSKNKDDSFLKGSSELQRTYYKEDIAIPVCRKPRKLSVIYL